MIVALPHDGQVLGWGQPGRQQRQGLLPWREPAADLRRGDPSTAGHTPLDMKRSPSKNLIGWGINLSLGVELGGELGGLNLGLDFHLDAGIEAL